MIKPRRAAAPLAFPRSGGGRAGLRPAGAAAGQGREEELGDLDRVQGGALAQVVADDEEDEPVLGVVGSLRIRPTSTSSPPAAAPGVGNCSTLIPGAPARIDDACSAESGSVVSSQTASAWPTRTGTRTQVALTGSDRQLQDLPRLLAQLLLFLELDPVEAPVHAQVVVLGRLGAEPSPSPGHLRPRRTGRWRS